LEELIEKGLLHPITNAIAPEWIAPNEGADVPNPPAGYVLSFMAFHVQGLGVPVSQILWVLPFWYEVELHNFNPNSITQAAIFTAVCEGTWASLPIGTSGFTFLRRSTSPRQPRVGSRGRW
jgi:hypothetical protein